MVILETAAIGAAGYGLYRGGDAAARKGKDTHKELQRERVRQSQKSELNSKTKSRQERIQEIMKMRQGSGEVSASSNSTRELSTSSSDVDDRHKNVIAKLRQSRSEAAKKQGPPGKLVGLFGGKRK